MICGADDLGLRPTVRALVGAVGVPVNILFTPGQRLARLAELGVARVSTGSLLFRVALRSAVRAAVAIRDGDAMTPLDAPSYAKVQSLTGTA